MTRGSQFSYTPASRSGRFSAGRSGTCQIATEVTPHAHRSKQEVPLRERQHVRRLAAEKLTVRTHFVCVRVHADARQRIVEDEVAFAEPPAAPDRHPRAPEPGQRA